MLKDGEATRGIIRNTLRQLADAVEPDQAPSCSSSAATASP
jgi:hypothetical protein